MITKKLSQWYLALCLWTPSQGETLKPSMCFDFKSINKAMGPITLQDSQYTKRK